MNQPVYTPLHRRPEMSVTLPGHFYYEPDVFLQEQENIFAKSWQLVAHRSQLNHTGDYICAEVAGESVFIIKVDDQQYRAFYNVCQHRAHQLVSGQGNINKLIICPYHAWTYNLDGSFVNARGINALPDFDKSRFGLRQIRIEQQLGFIFVNLDSEAPPLNQVAGSMFADIKQTADWAEDAVLDEAATGSSWEGSTLKANWKVLADNCRECYHCVPAHKAFVDMMEMKTYEFTVHKGWVKSAAKLGRENNKAYQVSREEAVSNGTFWHLWPNMEFGILPGEKSLSAFRSYPINSEETFMTALILSGDGSTVKKERLDYRWNILWPEDQGLCESVHKGLKSRGYTQGRFVIDPTSMGISENRVHAFQIAYAEAMGLPISGD